MVIWDVALHNAFGKYIDMPVVDFYGRHFKALPTSVTIGIMDVDSTIREARAYDELGFKVVKVKTGQTVDVDIERVQKIHENFKNMVIRVDANQGCTITDLQKFIEATKSLGLELIEQPTKVGEEAELSVINSENCKLLVADESLKNGNSAIQYAASPQPFGIYNIKLMKCGGVLEVFDIATIEKAAGIQLFWGCNDESMVSITAALHAAFVCSNTKYLDLDGSLDLAEDLVNGRFLLKDGMISISDKPGFGIELKN